MSLNLPNAIGTAGAENDLPYFEATWRDTKSDATGYVVLDRLVRGVASGGLRMRAGCTRSEVHGLARGMTLKEAIHLEDDAKYIPTGGGKGGINFDPYAPEAEQVLARFLQAMKPLIEQYWNMGEDFGVRQDTIDTILHTIGLKNSVVASSRLITDGQNSNKRLETAFNETVDGVALDELVGGYGVAEATLAMMGRKNMAPDQTRAFIQGFGSMGGATARYLQKAGVHIVGVADVNGVVTNQNGLDIEKLLATRGPAGDMDRSQLSDGDSELPLSLWLDVPAEVLIPAATSYCIDDSNKDRVQATLIAEASNMAVTPSAEDSLTARGITVVPDFFANSATNAWWWWVCFGDIDGTAAESFNKISDRMRSLSRQIFDYSDHERVSAREAAFALAGANLDKISTQYPTI